MKKVNRSRSRVSPIGGPTPADPQQERILSILSRRVGEPVTYDELKAAGIELPASVVSEMELAGIEIDRCDVVGPDGRHVKAVRLPAIAKNTPEPVPVRAPETPAPSPFTAGARSEPTPVPAAAHYDAASSTMRPSEAVDGAAARERWERLPSFRVLAALVLLAAAAVVAVVAISRGDAQPVAGHDNARLATTGHSGLGQTRRRGARASSATGGGRRAGSSSPRASAPAGAANAPGAPPNTAAPVTNRSSGSTEPAGAVQGFYESAAKHRYAASWALADPNMRAEVGGYAAFENQMTPVRAIVFHQIETVDRSAEWATLAVRTTSLQSDQTQQCWGTVRTVREAGAWLLDGISIHCD